MTTLIKPGRIAAACITDGPGAFKPEMVGQRAFNPRAKRFDSSRVLQHTRLAQLVECRPLKSEVRGSSPR